MVLDIPVHQGVAQAVEIAGKAVVFKTAQGGLSSQVRIALRATTGHGLQ